MLWRGADARSKFSLVWMCGVNTTPMGGGRPKQVLSCVGVMWSKHDAKRWGGRPRQVISCVVAVWSAHRGGSASRVYTERSDNILGVTLTLCVMRRYYLGEGDLASTTPFNLLV